jgi:hypothetical protein
LDVNPYNPPDGTSSTVRCELWAQKEPGAPAGVVRVKVAGNSVARGGSTQSPGPDGRIWGHEVQLRWEGLIELRADRISRITLWAEGEERLHWENAALNQSNSAAADVTHLPAGHFIDQKCAVRYGFVETTH